MVLSKATEYAIRALVYIRLKEGAHAGFREVADKIGAPEPFTAKILQTLVRKGILNSVKGPGGGFFLDPFGRNILLIQVIEALEGPSVFNRCGFGLQGCSPTNPCPVHDEYSAIRDEYKKLATSISIGSLAEKVRKGKAVINRMEALVKKGES